MLYILENSDDLTKLIHVLTQNLRYVIFTGIFYIFLTDSPKFVTRLTL